MIKPSPTGRTYVAEGELDALELWQSLGLSVGRGDSVIVCNTTERPKIRSLGKSMLNQALFGFPYGAQKTRIVEDAAPTHYWLDECPEVLDFSSLEERVLAHHCKTFIDCEYLFSGGIRKGEMVLFSSATGVGRSRVNRLYEHMYGNPKPLIETDSCPF